MDKNVTLATITTRDATVYRVATDDIFWEDNWYEAVLTVPPSLVESLKDGDDIRDPMNSSGAIVGSGITSNILNAELVIVVLTLDETGSVVSQITRNLVIDNFRREDNGVISFNASGAYRKQLEELFPSNKFKVADWPDLHEDFVDDPVPMVIGYGRKVPFVLTGSETTEVAFDAAGFSNYNKTYRYGVFEYIGPEIHLPAGMVIGDLLTPPNYIVTVYRNNKVIEDASSMGEEYLADYYLQGGKYYLRLRFPREQVDFNGNLYTIKADINFNYSSINNAVLELKRLLAIAGITINEDSFDAAEAVAVTNNMNMDFCYYKEKRLVNIISYLLSLLRASLVVNNAGEWELIQDTEILDFDEYDEDLGDPITVNSYEETSSSANVVLKFRPLSAESEDFTIESQEIVLDSGIYGEELLENPFIFNTVTAAYYLDYWSKRMDLVGRASVTTYKTQYSVGDGLTLASSRFWTGNKNFIVESVNNYLQTQELSLREYNEDVYTFSGLVIDTEESDNFTPDYSATFPEAPTNLVVTETSIDYSTATPTLTIDVEADPPIRNYETIFFFVEEYDSDGTTLLRVKKQEGTPDSSGTFIANIPGIHVEKPYIVYAYAVNEYGLEGTSIAVNKDGASVLVPTPPSVDDFFIYRLGDRFRLEWIDPFITNFLHVEVSKSDTLGGTKTVIGNSVTGYFEDFDLSVAAPYYWLRTVNTSLVPSATYTGKQAPVFGGVANLTLDTPFTGTFIRVRWDYNNEATDYRIRVKVSGVQKRETYTTDNYYTYTIDDAKDDDAVSRTLTIEVTPRDLDENLGAATEVSGFNDQISATTTFTVEESGYESAILDITPLLDSDLGGYEVHASTTSGFTPDSSTLKFYGNNANPGINLPNDEATTYYIKVGAYDVWGRDGITYSAEESVLVSTVQAILDKLTGEITSSQLGEALLSEIDLISGSGPGSVNERIDAGDSELQSQIDTLVSANEITVFEAAPGGSWAFQGLDTQGWVGVNGNLVSYGAGVRLTATTIDSSLRNLNLGYVDETGNTYTGIIGSEYARVRVRWRRLDAGTGWSGAIYWGTSGHGFSETHKIAIAEPTGHTDGDWIVSDWGMSASADWLASTINQLRIDLSEDNTADFEIDWIAIGRQTGTSTIAAAVEESKIVSAGLDGTLRSQWAVKTQVRTSDGEIYIAGIGLSIEGNDSGSITSRFIAAVDEFAIIDPSGASLVTPFLVSGGNVYISSAVIQDASITNAKIGNTIQASYNIGGQPAWLIDKAGSITARSLYIKNANNHDVVKANGAANGTVTRTSSAATINANSWFTVFRPTSGNTDPLLWVGTNGVYGKWDILQNGDADFSTIVNGSGFTADWIEAGTFYGRNYITLEKAAWNGGSNTLKKIIITTGTAISGTPATSNSILIYNSGQALNSPTVIIGDPNASSAIGLDPAWININSSTSAGGITIQTAATSAASIDVIQSGTTEGLRVQKTGTTGNVAFISGSGVTTGLNLSGGSVALDWSGYSTSTGQIGVAISGLVGCYYANGGALGFVGSSGVTHLVGFPTTSTAVPSGAHAIKFTSTGIQYYNGSSWRVIVPLTP